MLFRLGAVVALLALAGCSDRAPGGDYFPLEAGHRWHYVQSTQREAGEVEREDIELLSLPSEQLGPNWAYRRRSDSGMDYWLRADATGIYRVASKTDVQADPQPDAAPRYVLKAPLVVGTQWSADTTAYVLQRRQDYPPEVRHTHAPVRMVYTIAGVGESVTTPAGTHRDCLRVQGQAAMRLMADAVVGWRDVPLTTTEWYCRGIGLVKLRRDEPAAFTFLTGGSIEMELSSWQ